MPEITKDEAGILRRALKVATYSDNLNTQVGAVLVEAHGPRAVNGWNFRAGHAEIDAISKAACKGVRTADATMYCTWAACPMCAEAIVQAGIARVVTIFGAAPPCGTHWRDRVLEGEVVLRRAGVAYQCLEGRIGDAPEQKMRLLMDGREVWL